MEKTFITNRHKKNLPIIRIKKAVLRDFKSVGYGEVTFNCGREFVPCNSEADILGLYGQNGSGKTSLVEALSVLQYLMAGTAVPDIYADCISIEKSISNLEFVFDLQYPSGSIREASYSFSMFKKSNRKTDFSRETDNKVVIKNEKFALVGEDMSKKQLIIDSSSEDVPFTPAAKRKALAGNNKNVLAALEEQKIRSAKNSESFIFNNGTLSLFEEFNTNSVYFEVLVELRNYARHYLYVIDTKSAGFIRLNYAIPVYTRNNRYKFFAKEPTSIPDSDLENLKKAMLNTSSVLEQLVPGLAIGIKKLSQGKDEKGKPTTSVMLVAIRNGKEMPLRYESDGVRRILSVLSLFIAAFNQPSVTVAIDEFDAGIFEYLLGEILNIMEDYGVGQLIFTSHNLRPLEVISKKFICFTSTNPNNRYVRLKDVSITNNLRDTYFREIILDEQDEDFYNNTKAFKIISALMDAGGDC